MFCTSVIIRHQLDVDRAIVEPEIKLYSCWAAGARGDSGTVTVVTLLVRDVQIERVSIISIDLNNTTFIEYKVTYGLSLCPLMSFNGHVCDSP